MTWMITSTGKEYHLPGVSQGVNDDVFDIRDVAHHLALLNRFTGATSRPYSVAEHSLLCCDIAARAGVSPVVQLAALMHDAHKAYVSDLSSPAKIAIDRYSMAGGGVAAWKLFEAAHAKALRASFGLITVFSNQRDFLHDVDLQALATERRDLTQYRPGHHTRWDVIDTLPNVVDPLHWVNLNTPEREATTWREWRAAFLGRYTSLRGQVRAKFKEALAC